MEKRYGAWAGNPRGHAEHKERCIAEVHDDYGCGFHQCCRKRGFGPDKKYCKQHGKIEEKRRLRKQRT